MTDKNSFDDVILLPAPMGDSANTEITSEDVYKQCKEKPKSVRRRASTLVGIAVAMFVMIGTVSYGYLGYLAVKYFSEDGLARFVASDVFGGIITQVAPQISEPLSELELPVADPKFLSIVSENIGCSDPETVYNETSYDPVTDGDTAAFAPLDGVGKVLLIHTHGTESYAPSGSAYADEDFRDPNPENNIIAVGSAFAESLQSRGIEVIHCTEAFDAESYIEAYSGSGAAVAEYVSSDPEIKYVIDIHRDAVIRQNGDVVRSDGGTGAQLMIVCGTDEMGADFSRWRENFAFGKAYQKKLFETDPARIRHMNLRGASFNQQLCDKYILLEVGTCGNTLDEALDASRFAADAFADLILGE